MTGTTALAVARNGDLALTGPVGSLDAYLERVSHIPVLTRGKVLAEGDYRTVSANPQVRQAYMGDGHGYG